MNQYEHHSHISITRHTREGVTRTDVHIAQIGSFSGDDGDPEGVKPRVTVGMSVSIPNPVAMRRRGRSSR